MSPPKSQAGPRDTGIGLRQGLELQSTLGLGITLSEINSDKAQAWIGNPKVSSEAVAEMLCLGPDEALRRLSTIPTDSGVVPTTPATILSPSSNNPYAGQIIAPACGYPKSWGPMSWQDQLCQLQEIFKQYHFSDTGLEDMAQAYLADQSIWKGATFTRPGSSDEFRLWDGLHVFIRPNRLAEEVLKADLFEDLAKGEEGSGLWGRLCKEVIFPPLTQPKRNPRFPGFFNYRAGQMSSHYFLPDERTLEWLKELDASATGDFVCRPFSAGGFGAGRSVQCVRWEAEHTIDAIGGPAVLVGQYLLCDPGRLTEGALWVDLPGDRYRFEGYRVFDNAPCVDRDADGLDFSTNDVGHPHGRYGSWLLSR